jgi:hypothetical protein
MEIKLYFAGIYGEVLRASPALSIWVVARLVFEFNLEAGEAEFSVTWVVGTGKKSGASLCYVSCY